MCFRPENTHKGKLASHRSDLNLLYYSSEEAKVTLGEVAGRCEVMYSEELLDNRSKLDEYFHGAPDRFYFTEVGDQNDPALLLCPLAGAKYCNQFVCKSVTLQCR